jgi:hypothetical protein
MNGIHSPTGRLPQSKESAMTTASRIASLEAALSKNQSNLVSMTSANKVIWEGFKTAMVSQYEMDKCAQVYSNATKAWQTCCAYDILGSTSFSFCAASELLGLSSPGHDAVRGIDYGFDSSVVPALPVTARNVRNDVRDVLSEDDIASQADHQLIINTIPVYTINLFSGSAAGQCTPAQLQYACFSMCCDSAYATVRSQMIPWGFANFKQMYCRTCWLTYLMVPICFSLS